MMRNLCHWCTVLYDPVSNPQGAWGGGPFVLWRCLMHQCHRHLVVGHGDGDRFMRRHGYDSLADSLGQTDSLQGIPNQNLQRQLRDIKCTR